MSPTFLAMQVVVLTSGAPGALRRGWSLAAGSMTMLLLISFGGLSLLSALPDFQTGQPSYGEAVILIVAGLALLAVAAVIRRRPSHKDAVLERVVDAGPPVLFAVGALRLAINATTLALYIPALHMITQSSVDIAVKAVVFVVLFAITEIAVVGPVLAVTIMGDRAKPMLTTIHLAIEQRSRTLTLVICAGFGAVLIAVGIRVLTQVG
jgi:uncharacterized membrane protein YhaH (DUF805 family)